MLAVKIKLLKRSNILVYKSAGKRCQPLQKHLYSPLPDVKKHIVAVLTHGLALMCQPAVGAEWGVTEHCPWGTCIILLLGTARIGSYFLRTDN